MWIPHSWQQAFASPQFCLIAIHLQQTGSPMPRGEDSDRANDYPQRCDRASKQTLSNNTAPWEAIRVSQGFRAALPKHTRDFPLPKSAFTATLQGLGATVLTADYLTLSAPVAIPSVTLKSYMVLRAQKKFISQSQEPAMLYTDRR